MEHYVTEQESRAEIMCTHEKQEYPEDEFSYTIRPHFSQRFNPVKVKKLIKEILIEELGNRKYNSFISEDIVKYLTSLIGQKLNAMPSKRYKYVVQIALAENKGQGLGMTFVGFWDPDTDNFAAETITTEHLICSAVVYGVYFY